MKKIIAVISAILMMSTLTIGAFAATTGDVNGDGVVNSLDALNVLQYVVGIKVDDFNKTAADVNGDGKINSGDALKILQISVGLIKPDGDGCTNSDGHEWGGWVTTKAPTATAEGSAQRTCIYCSKTETITLAKLDSADAVYQEVLRLINVERAKEDVEPLQYCYAVQDIADTRANDLTTKFNKQRPDGSYYYDLLEDQDVETNASGEVISLGYNSPQRLVDGLMTSEDYSETLLSDAYTHVVIGMKNNYWSLIFLGFDA